MQNAYLLDTDPERILTMDQRLKALTPEQLVLTARKFYSGTNIFKAVWLPEMVK
jgi:hypothetical protein